MKKIIKCKKESDDFKINLEDDRFSVLKTSHLYAIDPSAPQYKETSETHKLRTVQAASLSAGSARTSAVSSEQSVIDKIKSRTAEFKSKKEKTKLFKTKNKGHVSIPVETLAEVDQVVKKKKKKKRDLEDVAVSSNIESGEPVKKKKKKRVLETDTELPVAKTKKPKKSKVSAPS